MSSLPHCPDTSIFARTKSQLAAWLPRTLVSWLTWMSLPMVVGASFLAFSQSSTPPAYPAVNLATEPLYASVTVDKPTLALALSVEFPTVGAQYTAGGSTDNTYSNTNEYLGYYDAESCYQYIDAPTETPASGQTIADYKRFTRISAATSRKCSDAFSGNFLNWASNSAIDMLRLALSGGDRYIDTTNLTVLQRAVIPHGTNGTSSCMWNTSNFPAKQLSRNGGGANAYWGAVPNSMITQANGQDIWVANTLNRIYFKAGTSASGSCGNTADYLLGSTIVTEIRMESPIRSANSLPSNGMTLCINGESGTCNFSGIKEVWYGAGSNWFVAAAKDGVNCSAGCNAIFGDPISGTGKKVYYRNYSGSWTPTTTTAGSLNSDGFFYARVEVCNVDAGSALLDSRDYGLCKQYPSGKYKPVGVIQKYSDQMRLAAFGYLMDQTQSAGGGRYGGVLRAPMKYVGAKTYDATGTDNTPVGGNAAAEWNANTGVLATNPDAHALGTSGVINYLNKFGRTGVLGLYKTYDPVGELHYETLRYLQGLEPTPAAVSSITAAMRDGFPVYDTWTDPYGVGYSNTANYACVKSNIVVVGDINTWDGNRLPSPSAANNIPDIAYWRGVANSFERNSGGTYVDGQGDTQTIANPNPPNNSMPTSTDRSQIIGSAYWAHIKDIRGTGWTAQPSKQRPGLRVKTFVFDVNEYGGSNNYNTRSTSNQFFMAAKYGGFEADPSNLGSKPYNTKGNPFKRQGATTDVNDNAVWQKAGTPGDPLSYYLQSNARGVLSAFDEIFSRAATASRSIAGGGASSSRTSSNTAIYTARFDTSNWSGDVVAEPVTLNTTTSALTIGTPLWSAANMLDNRTSAASSRNILVGRESATASPAATNFTWAAIDSTLKTHLNKATPTATADTLGQDRLDYLRGDRTKEGNPFRVRSSLLGDIVNSNVVYSGAPSKGFTGAGYSAFATAFASRTPAVFAGANDGMLHAFNANTGAELFGFIPSWLGPKLPALSAPEFADNHQNYVDAPIAVGEAQVASNNTSSDWKTVLVSGTGGGGSGVFALDVSDPAAFDASKVMWEFKRTDDADIGQVIGQPRIMKFKTSGSSSTATYRWFAVVASGVNNYVPDAAGNFSSTGKPALFLLALDKPVGTAWVEGTNYYKITLPLDTTLAATTAPGLANFSALYGSNGEVTEIYMGDLHGKLWKLSFGSLTPANWNMGKLSFFNRGTASSPVPYPMFIAKTGNTVQPITAPPRLFTGPIVDGIETFYITFGTGKYLESADKISTLSNSFYALYDNGSSAADSSPSGDSAISGRGRLIAGTVNTTTGTITVGDFKWGRPTSNGTTTSRSGWYFDMPALGEKLVSQIVDVGPRTGSFSTVIPGSSGAPAGSCTNSPGSGKQYIINVLNGAGRFVTTDAPPAPPMIFNTQETDTKSDSTGRRIRSIVNRSVIITTQGLREGLVETTQETVGRLTWRQIHNYQDLKN